MIYQTLSRLLPGSVDDLRNGQTGGLRFWPAVMLFGIPLVLAVATWRQGWFLGSPSALLPGSAVITGALLGLLTLMFNRLKDSVAKERPEAGPDPAFHAHVAFRSVLYAARVSLLNTGLLIVMIVVSADESDPNVGAQHWIVQSGLALSTALFVHVGIKVALVLTGLRYQADQMAGNRAVAPLPFGIRSR